MAATVLGGFIIVVLLTLIILLANGTSGTSHEKIQKSRTDDQVPIAQEDSHGGNDTTTDETKGEIEKDGVSADISASDALVLNATASYTVTPQVESPETTIKMASYEEAYIFPDSNSRYLTESELTRLTEEELRLARNELYARHGRMFDDPVLREYFSSKTWYQGTVSPDAFDEAVFNQYEIANRDLIVRYEEKRNVNY